MVPSFPEFVRIRVNPELTYRKIYCYMQIQMTNNSTDYMLNGQVDLMSERKSIGQLPCGSGRDVSNTMLTAQNGSLASLFTAYLPTNNPSSRDSVLVVFSSKFTGGDTTTQPDKVLLLPAYLQSDCDEIVFSLKAWKVYTGYSGVGFRAFLACHSSSVPF